MGRERWRVYIRFILHSFNFVSVSVPAVNVLPTNNSTIFPTGESSSTTFRHDDTESATTSPVIADHRPNHLHRPAPARGSRRNSNDLKLCLRKEQLNESDSPNRGRTQTFLSRNSKDRLKAMAEFDRRGSLESSEFRRLRNLKEPDRRSSSGLKHLSSLNKSVDNLVSENHSNERPVSTASIGLKSPRQRKISNIFRKISVNSRSSSKTNLAKIKGKPYIKTTEEDLIRERDHAIDEWSRSATKCEELVDEVDMMLSHLASVRALSCKGCKCSQPELLLGITLLKVISYNRKILARLRARKIIYAAYHAYANFFLKHMPFFPWPIAQCT